MFKAEYLFLENIYTEKEMKRMGIDNFHTYSKKLNKILDELVSFCESIESENLSSSRVVEQDPEIEGIIERIKQIKQLPARVTVKLPKKKQLPFCISTLLVFYRQTKLREIFQFLKMF